jgi:hypothetical protein
VQVSLQKELFSLIKAKSGPKLKTFVVPYPKPLKKAGMP